MQAKKPTLGLRVPDSPLLSALLALTGEPLVSVTLELPGQDHPMVDPDLIEEQLGKLLDILIDGGAGGDIPSTIVDLTGDEPVIIREGLGDTGNF